MRNNIIILSHNTHAFLLNEIKYASEIFERVVVICPANEEFKNQILKISNVEFLSYSKKEIYINMLLSLKNIIQHENLVELKEALDNKLLSKQYIKVYLYFLALSKLLEKKISRDIKLSSETSRHWVLYSAWYYSTAYSIVKVGEKYKNLKLVSLAHSFEIDKIKNKYTKLLFRKLYHDKIDVISFISKNVLKIFESEIANDLNLDMSNIEVRMLGSQKLEDGYTRFSDDGIIRVLSCSHMVPIKRLDLIFDSLDSMKSKIEWTHIGDGKLRGYIEDKIKNKKNCNLNVTLLGSLENKKIHKYYSNNRVDCFINVSASEGIPVSIMEAISYGVPVIATDVGGNSEIVKQSFGKIISSNPTKIEIQEAILEIVNCDHEKKVNMKNNAKIFFEQNFNSDNLRKDFFLMLKND